MNIKVTPIQSTDFQEWDSYVINHPNSTLYHLFGWKNIIEKTYRHTTYYLMATREPEGSQLTAHSSQLSAMSYELNGGSIAGILPLVHLKHFLFGNSLISIPFFDLGGILADDEDTEKALLSEAIKLVQKLTANTIELRHVEPLSWLAHSSQLTANGKKNNPMNYDLSAISCVTKSHKVRMLLNLPESSEELMKSFKAKLRSQIKKPLKEDLNAKIGGLELLADFYKVFSVNMKDLGSPVHSRNLMQNVLEEFPEESRIVIVYKDNKPLACSLVVGFKNTLENPWASALRQYSRLGPNMLLYWTMLEYACDNDFRYFDFGRSSPDEGTYKFKEQWGAKPTQLHWHYISLNGNPIDEQTSEKSKFDKAIRYWQKLPVPVTKVMGPMIRKHIGL
jgi:FemAB-related protein (PEP-CTERM system-associated)